MIMKNSEILNRNFYFILQADKYVHSDQFKDYSELQNANRLIVANHPEIQEEFLSDMTDCLRNFYKKYSKGCFWNDIAFKIYEKMKTDGIDGNDETLYYKQLNLNPLYDIYKPNNDEKVIYAALNILSKFQWKKEGI